MTKDQCAEMMDEVIRRFGRDWIGFPKPIKRAIVAEYVLELIADSKFGPSVTPRVADSAFDKAWKYADIGG